jgi:K+-sensing histidine kinase KdpD
MKNISKNQINHIDPINHGSDNSYDIIKAHGGEIKVESEEGEGSDIIILLPALSTLNI